MDEPSVLPQPPTSPSPTADIPPVVTPPKSRALPLTVLGLVLVALIGSGAIILIKFSPRPSTPPQLAQAVPATPAPQPLFLELTSPKSGEQAVDSEIIASGRTLPDTTVIIYTESDETSVESDADGKFETTITLGDGSNVITATAFSENGEEASQSIVVVYDSQIQL